ncbi:MAG: YfcE family phosphodiesterase [Promethearchaeota archaeon]
MVKLLLIGDSHVPQRAKKIPEKIYDKLSELAETELFDYTFFTGDLIKCSEFIDFLNLNTLNDLFIVIGNMDYFGGNRNAPIYQKLKLTLSDNEKLTIGLTHGHQISPRGDLSKLEHLAIENNFTILISGHTHKEEIYLTEKGILLLNPGSVTGAWSFVASGIPSFIEVNINEKTTNFDVNLFQLERKSDKIVEFKSYFMFNNNQILHGF